MYDNCSSRLTIKYSEIIFYGDKILSSLFKIEQIALQFNK